MNFKKTGVISFLNQVVGKLKGKWTFAIASSLVIAFLVYALVDILNLNAIVAAPLLGFVFLGEIVFMRKLLSGEEYKLEDLFGDFKLFIPAFLTMASMMLLISVGFALLILPGISFLISYSFALHILADNKELGALEALKASKAMTKGYRFKIGMFYLTFLIFSVIAFAFGLVISLVPNLIWGTNLLLYAGIIAGVVAVAFVYPFFYASLTMLYEGIKNNTIVEDDVEESAEETEVQADAEKL
ncbi:MAG: hypothetical protein AB7S44_01300 [Spirochaetales bacterium]